MSRLLTVAIVSAVCASAADANPNDTTASISARPVFIFLPPPLHLGVSGIATIDAPTLSGVKVFEPGFRERLGSGQRRGRSGAEQPDRDRRVAVRDQRWQRHHLGLQGRARSPSAGRTQGEKPVSVTVNNSLVYVLNSGEEVGDLFDEDGEVITNCTTGRLPSVTGFRVDPDGELEPIPNSTRLLSGASFSGCPQVSFNPTGDQLVVTEREVATELT
jgi:hypothetical protein